MVTPMSSTSTRPPSETQRDLVAAFESGKVEGVSLATPRIDTHISHVFLTEARAYKLKRSVKLPFVDFSTTERRRAACEAELKVNRWFAGELYLGVQPLVRLSGGRYRIGGDAPDAVDWVVEMRRFEQAGQFDELARAGGLTPALVDEAAEIIAAAHRDCPPVATAGHAADYRAILNELRKTEAQGARQLGLAPGESNLFERLNQALARLDPRIEARRRAGKVRRTHGDLHLRNICLFEGRPTPFDALEFDDRLATTDVLYDLAFLLMDLVRLGQADAANRLMNRYWDAAGEAEDALALLPFFMALRAIVRLAVDVEAGALEEADVYRRLANRLIARSAPVALAIGGLSGCGKSTIARRVAPHLPGAGGGRLLRSDVLRKEAAGAKADYAPGARATVYTDLFARGEAALSAGASVILDATFQDEAAREAALRAARGAFVAIWLDAPLTVRLQRVRGRTGDPSDADVDVARAQPEPSELSPRWRRVDATGDPETVTQRVFAALGL